MKLHRLYRLLGQETFEGKKYDVIELTPEDVSNQMFKVKLWISPANYTIKQWMMFEKSGNRYTYVINNFKENISLSTSSFKFDKSKYPGVLVTDLRD